MRPHAAGSAGILPVMSAKRDKVYPGIFAPGGAHCRQDACAPSECGSPDSPAFAMPRAAVTLALRLAIPSVNITLVTLKNSAASNQSYASPSRLCTASEIEYSSLPSQHANEKVMSTISPLLTSPKSSCCSLVLVP